MKKLILVCLLFSSITITKITAQISGTLDTTFDTTGVLIMQPGTYHDVVYDVASQHDGKILFCGVSRVIDTTGTNFDIVVGRRNNDGTNDSTFGTNGLVVKDFGIASDYAYKMTLQNDGKILIASAASLSPTNTEWVIMRLQTNGNYDSTFNNNGIVEVDMDTSEDYAYDLIVQPDDKIVVVGTTKAPGFTYDRATIIRLNSNGTLDSSFATNGINIIQPSLNTLSQTIRSVKLLPGGNIVTCGWNLKNGAYQVLLAGFTSNGNLNPLFGTNGVYLNNTGVEQAYDLLVINGYLYCGGTSSNSGGSDLTLTRLDTLGVLDNLFGSNGTVRNSFNPVNVCFRMTLQPDGKILAGGTSGQDTSLNFDFLAVRFLQNGVMDPTFGTNGYSIVSIGPSEDEAFGITLQDDGKIILGGVATFTDGDMAIIRLLNDSGAIANSIPFLSTKNNNWMIYPTPISGNELYLSGDFSGSQSLNISIFNMNGELVSEYNHLNPPAIRQQIILTLPSSISKGIYYVRISTQKEFKVLPLIKF